MKLTVLYIEDNADDAKILYHALNKKGLGIDFHTVPTLKAAMDLDTVGRIDIIFLDLNLPDVPENEGLTSLRRVVGKWPEVPVIVLSGHFSEMAGIHFTHEGAMDEIDKNQITMDDRLLGRKIVAAMQRKSKTLDHQRLIQRVDEAFRRNDALERRLADAEAAKLLPPKPNEHESPKG